MKVYMAAGPHHIPGWLNTDIRDKQHADGRWFKPDVIVDMAKPLPWTDDSLEAITESHGLMFLTPEQVGGWFVECFRVLRPGGTLRVTEDEAIRRPKIYGGGRWKMWNPREIEAMDFAKNAGFLTRCVAELETVFGDPSICVNLHSGRPKAWFVECVKPERQSLNGRHHATEQRPT